jgi:DNA replication protein DnaC
MSAPLQPELRLAAIRQQCTQLHLPTVSAQAGRLVVQAVTAHHDHLTYLEALLGAELDERERRTIDRRITEAHFPRVQTVDTFNSVQRRVMCSWT